MKNPDFRKLQGELDKLGIATHIERIDKKKFNYIVNFEIIKTFRNRISAKRRIIKIYNLETNAPTLF